MSSDAGIFGAVCVRDEGVARSSCAEGRSWEFRDGLLLYCLDQSLRRQQRFRTTASGCRVHIVLSLEGKCRLRLGAQSLPLCSSGAGACGGLALYLDSGERLEGVVRSDGRQRLLIVSLPQAWAETLLEQRCRDHSRICRWQPSGRASAIAGQLLNQASHDSVLQRLMMESRLLELLAEALAPLVCQGACCAQGLYPGGYVRAERLRSLIERGALDECSLGDIAARMCCNVTTLQQQFRAAYGRTIIEFRRVSRLERAAQALRLEGVSVARAAEIAGYTSQANFSTAFRRHFGQLPKHVRERV